MTRVLLLLLATFVACAPSSTTPDARARRIASEVWSPYCPGRLLSECTTRQADELRAEIRERARRGETDEQIKLWLRDNYGDAVLADASGPAVWLVPAAGVGLGAVALAFAVRRWSRTSPPAAA